MPTSRSAAAYHQVKLLLQLHAALAAATDCACCSPCLAYIHEATAVVCDLLDNTTTALPIAPVVLGTETKFATAG